MCQSVSGTGDTVVKKFLVLMKFIFILNLGRDKQRSQIYHTITKDYGEKTGRERKNSIN